MPNGWEYGDDRRFSVLCSRFRVQAFKAFLCGKAFKAVKAVKAVATHIGFPRMICMLDPRCFIMCRSQLFSTLVVSLSPHFAILRSILFTRWVESKDILGTVSSTSYYTLGKHSLSYSNDT